MSLKNEIPNSANNSDNTSKIILLIWLATSLVLTFANYHKNSFISINNLASLLHFLAGFLGTFLAVIIPGIVLGLIVLGVVWVIKKDSKKAFNASAITALLINILMLSWL